MALANAITEERLDGKVLVSMEKKERASERTRAYLIVFLFLVEKERKRTKKQKQKQTRESVIKIRRLRRRRCCLAFHFSFFHFFSEPLAASVFAPPLPASLRFFFYSLSFSSHPPIMLSLALSPSLGRGSGGGQRGARATGAAQCRLGAGAGGGRGGGGARRRKSIPQKPSTFVAATASSPPAKSGELRYLLTVLSAQRKQVLVHRNGEKHRVGNPMPFVFSSSFSSRSRRSC